MRYYHTVRYLKWIQIRYRAKYLFRQKFINSRAVEQSFPNAGKILNLEELPASGVSYFPPHTFKLLNRKVAFDENIDWNYHEEGKLWSYHLNYFDFLNQSQLSKEEGLYLIRDFISKEKILLDGSEPFPTSLRIRNWIKFLCLHKVSDRTIDQSLNVQGQRLASNLEYHLLGNHLLENAFALYFLGMYFSQAHYLSIGEQIIRKELKEQILKDGAHFELSPMYHRLILSNVLDLVNLIQSNDFESKGLLNVLKHKASLMLGWLEEMTFSDGSLPHVNDAFQSSDSSIDSLTKYADLLGIRSTKVVLKECGYRWMRSKGIDLFIDVGDIGPDYIPGHAHSDTFNFLLHFNARPFIVDTGVSTYEKNERRNDERSTAAHNTVRLGNIEQSDVWAGFRVGRRAKVIKLEEGENYVRGWHDGFKRFSATHSRSFELKGKTISIKDIIPSRKTAYAFLHFHEHVRLQLHGKTLKTSMGEITFSNASSIDISTYQLAKGYNITVESKMVTIAFNQQLTTKIELNENTILY